jgi:hypothetical protein
MGNGKDKFRERSRSTLRRERGNEPLRDGAPRRLLVLSFKDLDRNQGQRPSVWEERKLLALVIEHLQGLCHQTPADAKRLGLLHHYGPNCIPKDSGFTHPRHVPLDAEWCSIRVQGRPRVIGYIDDNILYIVFLDIDHEFWPSELG